MLTAPSTTPVRWSTAPGRRSRPPRRRRQRARAPPPRARPSSASCESIGVGALDRARGPAVRGRRARRDLRAAEIDADDARAGQGGGYPTSPDGAGRKALSRLPRRSGQGQGPGAPAPGRSRDGGRAASRKPRRRPRPGGRPTRRRLPPGASGGGADRCSASSCSSR